MKKLSILALSAVTAATLSACSGMTQTGLCDDRQTIGCAPYTDERTVYASPKMKAAPAPAPVATPAPAPVMAAPAPVMEPVEPYMMQSAEPQFKQRAK